MDNLFDKWKTRVPKYDAEFRKPLFDTLSKKYAGSEKTRLDLGKHFGSNYELYMYAFFLGLYHGDPSPIPEKEKKDDFGHPIQYWGNKTTLNRKDFSALQEYMFMALIANSDVDFIALEKGEISEEDVIWTLIQTMESYANSGLIMIKEKAEEDSNFFLHPTVFLNMILKTEQ